MASEWRPSSWRSKPVQQQPEYADAARLQAVVDRIRCLPPIVQPLEVDKLRKFVLQGGDCAEAFMDCSQDAISSRIHILLQMSLVLLCGTQTPVVRIGRIAGQYMKPRSKATEEVDGRSVCVYRGDSINSFDLSEREPNPDRILQAYFHAAATFNFVRGLLACGFGCLDSLAEFPDVLRTHKEHMNAVQQTQQAVKATALKARERQLGGDLALEELYSSHEGLLLPYEEAMTRLVSSKYYNLGAHFLWIGDRTRQLDGAHVEYFRGIANPIGVKIGPGMTPSEVVELTRVLNPDNVPGKLVLITRLGARSVAALLPPIVEAVQGAGAVVVWECDPMHGNTTILDSGVKTRYFSDILDELSETFKVHRARGSWLGGVHFELTGDAVTECIGGASGIQSHELHTRYESFCDPRLNSEQGLELAFFLVNLFRDLRASRSASIIRENL